MKQCLITTPNGAVEAKYEDGYVHSEIKLSDCSQFIAGKNVFNDILEKRPEVIHGKMIELSCYYNKKKHSIDWTRVPSSARPVRFKKMKVKIVNGEIVNVGCIGLEFGYEYNDIYGNTQKEIMRL